MKNLKRFLSIVLAIAICCMMTSVFAAPIGSDEYSVELVPSKTEVAPGEEFNVKVYITRNSDKTSDIDFSSIYGQINVLWTGDVTVCEPSAIIPPSGWSAKDITKGEGFLQLFYEAEVASTLNDKAPYATIACTAGTSGEIKFSSTDEGVVDTVVGDAVTITDLGTCTVTIKAADPDPEYTVTFKNGDTVVATETATKDNSYKVTAPADPKADKGKVFDGWYDGETKFDADTVITNNVTYVAMFSDKVLPDPTLGKISEAYEDAADYTNVWVGKYYAEPATGTKLTSFGVKYAEDAKATFTKDMTGIDGEARIEFSVALIGVKTVDAISGNPFATADWAE